MKNFLTIVLVVFTMCLSAQNYKTHKVKSGETIESIAKQYLVTPFDIFALNPDAKSNFGINTTLIIPNSKVKNNPIIEDKKEVIGTKKHRVKRKETLFSISQKYDVSIDEIKKANPKLYAETLRKGDRIVIPRFKTIISKQTLSNTLKKYTVQQSEGKWRIAYKFGITVSELEALNPKINTVIQPGDVLNVPNIAFNEEKATENTYNYYEVQKSEGFLALKRKLGLTQDDLEALNPDLKVLGLKLGMVLKIPTDVIVESETPLEAADKTELTSEITNTETKRLALLLPFRLNRIDMDSVAEVKDIMKKDQLLATALDFHSGVLMALESAKKLGISSYLKVFDTEYRTSEISNIIDRNDFSKYDAVIGPMMTKTFDRFAAAVKEDKVPVIAPFIRPTKVYSHVFQTMPEEALMTQKMIAFVKADSTKTNIVLVADQNHKGISNKLKSEFSSAKQIYSEKNKKGQDRYFIFPKSFETGVFVKGKNIVFLETDNAGLASSVISILNGLSTKDTEIILMTTNRNKAFESKEVDNYHLSNLKFHYPSVNKSFDAEKPIDFIKAYKANYGVSPSKYAIRGYDLTLDILLRLAASEDNLYENSGSDIETEYIENKFRYSKTLFGGYVNEAVYIVKYHDLKIVEAN